MSKFRGIASVVGLGLLILSGCASQTYYSPAGENTRYGYAEEKLERNRYRVEFRGNVTTNMETVERYLLFRAAELTLANGGTYFIMIERETDKEISYRSTITFPSRYHHEHYFFYHYYHDPFYGPGYGPGFGFGAGYQSEMRPVARYTAVAEILIMSGAKPEDNPHAYEAASVIEHLSADIQRPPAN